MTTEAAYNGSTYDNGAYKTHTYGTTLAYDMTIENVIGSDSNDQIVGNAIANSIQGRRGDDQITGNGGDDILDGGKGNDVLIGGQGRDVLTGGEGQDTFVYKKIDHRRDIITDFELGIDKIDLSDIFKDFNYTSANAFKDYVKLGAIRRRHPR